MKKYILGLVVGLAMFSPLQAQVVTPTPQESYISALQQVIELLTQQVAILVEQLKLVQAQNTIQPAQTKTLNFGQAVIQEKLKLVMFSYRINNKNEYRLETNKPIDFNLTTLTQGQNLIISTTTEILPNTYKIYLSDTVKDWTYGNVNLHLVSTDGDIFDTSFEISVPEFNISR